MARTRRRFPSKPIVLGVLQALAAAGAAPAQASPPRPTVVQAHAPLLAHAGRDADVIVGRSSALIAAAQTTPPRPLVVQVATKIDGRATRRSGSVITTQTSAPPRLVAAPAKPPRPTLVAAPGSRRIRPVRAGRVVAPRPKFPPVRGGPPFGVVYFGQIYFGEAFPIFATAPPRPTIIQGQPPRPHRSSRVIRNQPAVAAAASLILEAQVTPPRPVIVVARRPAQKGRASHVTSPRPTFAPTGAVTTPPQTVHIIQAPPAASHQQARARTSHVVAPRPQTLYVPRVTFDAAANGGTTFTHTCTGTNRYLVVGVAIGDTTTTVTGVTYAGTSLTLLQRSVGSAFGVELWGLANPASGANSVIVSKSSGTGSAQGAVSFVNAAQSGQPGQTGPASATSGTVVDASLWSPYGSMIVDVVGTDNAITIQTGKQAWNDGGGDGQAYLQSEGVFANPSWTKGASSAWVSADAVVLPVGFQAQQPRQTIVEPVSSAAKVQTRRRGSVVAPRPAALAVTQATPTVTPTRTVWVIEAQTPRQHQRGSVNAPRPSGLIFTPAATATPPRTVTIVTARTAAGRVVRARVVAPRPVFAPVAPPRPTVVDQAAFGKRKPRLGQLITRRVVTASATPPRPLVVHVAERRRRPLARILAPLRQRFGTGIGPPPSTLITTPATGYVTVGDSGAVGQTSSTGQPAAGETGVPPQTGGSGTVNI